MPKKLELIADQGKRRKGVTDDPGKRLRERALTLAENRALADQQRARDKLEWYLGLADSAVTK